MSYFLKSALGYLGGAAASVGQDNDFVGQYVELGPQKLRVKRVIAEGVLAWRCYVTIVMIVSITCIVQWANSLEIVLRILDRIHKRSLRGGGLSPPNVGAPAL